MAPPESKLFAPGRSLTSVTSITDLTDKITRPSGLCYSAAGGFGDVFQCQCTSEEGVKEVAVKAFRFSFSVHEDEQDEGKAARMIRRELEIWRRLDHPNIVPFLGIAYGFGRQGSASLVSMWMPHGTLHAFLKAHSHQLVVAHRLQLLVDVANGLHYLHSFPMVHGDLTSNNVLLDHNYNARLTDFGCASLVGELPEGFTELVMSTLKPGTLRWTAPEHISPDEEEAKHTVKSDIYSFGHIALFMLSGKYPWSEVRNDAAVVLLLARGLKPGRPLAPTIDDRHWALIERCWSSASERPLAEDLISSLRQLLNVVDVPGTVSLAESLMTRRSTPPPLLTLGRPFVSPMDEHDIDQPAAERRQLANSLSSASLDRPMASLEIKSECLADVHIQLRHPPSTFSLRHSSGPPSRRPHSALPLSVPTSCPFPQGTKVHGKTSSDWVTQVNTTSWFGTFSGTLPQPAGHGATELQIHMFGLFQVTRLMPADIRPEIRTDLWPKNIRLNFCKELVKSNTELSFWLKRHQPWMRLMRFRPSLMEEHERKFRALNKFMTEHRVFAYAGWQLPTGKFSYNIFIFPMGANFAGAVFPDGLLDLPGSGNALEVQQLVREPEPQAPLSKFHFSPALLARIQGLEPAKQKQMIVYSMQEQLRCQQKLQQLQEAHTTSNQVVNSSGMLIPKNLYRTAANIPAGLHLNVNSPANRGVYNARVGTVNYEMLQSFMQWNADGSTSQGMNPGWMP